MKASIFSVIPRHVLLSLGVLGLSAAVTVQAQTTPALSSVEQVQLDQYLGVWYEIARKPLSFQNKCAKDVTARYSLNENGNIHVDNRCVMDNGKTIQSIGEAFIQNAPQNSQLKVSFLPEVLRWLPVGRGDYWVLKLDPQYQTVLVGEPKRKYLWLLSRQPVLDQATQQEYLQYAQSVGYDLKDVIFSPHSAAKE